jgi:hypothetical protein
MFDLPPLPEGAKISAIELVLPDNLSFDKWKEILAALGKSVTAKQWHLGDCWAYGGHKYGKRAEAVAKKLIPYSFGYLANLGSVARRIKPSCRHEALSFSHHEVVANASLGPKAQKEWFAKAAEGGWSAKKLRNAIQPKSGAVNDDAGDDDDGEAAPQSEIWIMRRLQQIQRAVALSNLADDFDESDLAGVNIEKLKEVAAEYDHLGGDCIEYAHSIRNYVRAKGGSFPWDETESDVAGIAADQPEAEPDDQPKKKRKQEHTLN